MVMTVHCDVVSAEESIFSGVVEIAVFPGEHRDLDQAGENGFFGTDDITMNGHNH